MRGQHGLFDVDDRLARLSDLGDQLEAFRAAADFGLLRPELNAALAYSDGVARPATAIRSGYTAIRSGDDVQDPDHLGDEQSLRRAHRVSHQ